MAKITQPQEATSEECLLLDAAKNGNLREVERLISKGVNPNARDHRDIPWEVTPLMHAAKGGHVEVVRALINAGADLTLRDRGIPGMEGGLGTALHYAVNFGQEAVAYTLLRSGAKVSGKVAGHSVLSLAALRGLEGIVSELLRMKVNPNVPDSEKSTPLHDAAMYGFVNIVNLLLEAGAEVDPKNKVGETPLASAASFGQSAVVNRLLSAGANPNEQNLARETPLHHVASRESVDIAKALLNSGASLNIQDQEGRTPLDIAIRCRERKMAEFLRGRGALSGEELRSASRTEQAARVSNFRDASPVSGSKPRPIAETPEFAAAIEELSKASGVSPIRSKEIPGGVFFKISEEDRRRLVLEFHHPFLKRGWYVFASNHHMGIYPTADKYEVLRAMGTNGANYNVSTERIIAELKAIEAEQPFVLLGVGPDFVSGEFTTPLENARSLAKRLYQLCPDMVDQGAGTLATAAAELKRTRQLFLWWD
jgi:ankyrin repeat protein